MLISQSVRFGGWDLIGGGVIDLAFLLLDTQPPLGKVTPRLAALGPLLRLARSLRDPLILVLRKALFARSQETRQVQDG